MSLEPVLSILSHSSSAQHQSIIIQYTLARNSDAQRTHMMHTI